MRLEIELKGTNLPKSFAIWLTGQMKANSINFLSPKRLKAWDSYFSEHEQFQTKSNKPIKAKDIIAAGMSNLQIKYTNSLLIIRINPNIYIPGLNRVKLIDVCNLINYGNLEIPGYPIFSKVFNFTANNITSYVEIYRRIFRVRKHGRKILR